jgi:hypothetical protein
MSILETILTRAMSDPTFADLLFADVEKALSEYELTADEIATLKSMSRAEFETLDAENRRSMSVSAAKKTTTEFPAESVSLNFGKTL